MIVLTHLKPARTPTAIMNAQVYHDSKNGGVSINLVMGSDPPKSMIRVLREYIRLSKKLSFNYDWMTAFSELLRIIRVSTSVWMELDHWRKLDVAQVR